MPIRATCVVILTENVAELVLDDGLVFSFFLPKGGGLLLAFEVAKAIF